MTRLAVNPLSFWSIKCHESNLVHTPQKMEFFWDSAQSKVNVQRSLMFANTISQTLSPLTDSGDNNVQMQSVEDFNQSLFDFVCLILLLFFTKNGRKSVNNNRFKVMTSILWRTETLTYSTKINQNHVLLISPGSVEHMLGEMENETTSSSHYTSEIFLPKIF